MSEKNRAELLLDNIASAFGGVVRPQDEGLLHPSCSDDMDLEWLYPHKGSWQDLLERPIEHETATLAFLSPAGFQWALPAYLTYVLQHYETIQSTLVEDTIHSLSPFGELYVFMESKFSELDATQRKVVREFLAFFKEYAPHIPYKESFAAGLSYWEVHA
jgi:hypothetical protein